MTVYVDYDSLCHIEFARPHNSIRKGIKYMKKSLIASLLIFGAASAFAAGARNLTGNWSVHNSIAGNESDQECKFVQTENKLTGTCKGTEKDVKITGSIDGKKVTWKYESEYN